MLIKASNPIHVIYEEEEEEVETSSAPISITEAFEQASSTLQISDSPKEETKGEIVEPAATTEEPEEVEEVKTEDDKPEESDFENIDPKTLPPELKSVYDNLMKGFTKGRQKDSEARKAAEARIAELEKKLASDPQSKGDEFSELTSDELSKLTPQEQAEYYSALTEYKAQKAVTSSKIEDYRNQALADYESADVRLQRPSDDKPNEKYDRFMDSAIGAALDEALDQYIQSNGSELGFPHKEKLAELVQEYDEVMKARYESFIKEQNQRIKESTDKTRKSAPKTSNAKATPSKPTLGEALKMAHEKMGI